MFAPSIARLSLVGAVLLASPSLYAARLAVLSPKVDSDSPVSDGRRNKFHDSLSQGLVEAAGSEWTVLSSEEVRLRLVGRDDLLACQQGSCAAQVAALLQVDRVIVSNISMKSAIGGSAYQIRLTALDPSGKQGEVTHTDRCGDDNEGCNLSRAFDSLRKSSLALVPKLKVAPAAPVEVARPAPERPSSSPDNLLKDPSSTPAPSASAAVIPSPATPSTTPSTPATRHIGYRIGWVASGILAGGLLITSIPFLVLSPRDGQPTCTDGRPSNQCPTRYQGNLATGLGLLGGGLAAATAFGVLYYLDRRDLKRSSGQVALFPFLMEHGSGLSAVARF
jgi:hypothetical protein